MGKRIILDEQGFKRDWMDGMRIKDMAVKYDVNDATVSKAARRLGCLPRYKTHKRVDGETRHLGLPAGVWVRGPHGVRHWVAS